MKQRTLVTVVLCLGAFMASLDLFIVNIAFPAIQADFGDASLSSLSWVLNAYTIVFAALLIPSGRWADAFGRKRVFLVGLGLFSAASAACAAAGSVEVLVALRAVQAAGAALLLPTSLALLMPEYPPEKRSVVVAVWAAVAAVAAAAGPPLGGVLVQLDWRWIFLVNVPVGLGAALVGTRILREQHDPSTTRPDELGAGLLGAGVAALVAGIVEGPVWGWSDPRILASFTAAAALFAIVARRSTTHPAPVVEPALVRVRSFSMAVVAAMVFFMGFGAFLLSSVLFLTQVWHESVLTAGLQIAPGPATAAITALPGARLAQKIGMPAVGALGAALFALGFVWWLAQAGDTPDWAGTYLPGGMIAGAGVGFVIPTVTGAATALLPPERFATGAAVVTTGRQIGIAVGVAVLVAVLGTPHHASDFHAAWGFIIGTASLSGVLLAGLGRICAPATAAAPAPVVSPPIVEPGVDAVIA